MPVIHDLRFFNGALSSSSSSKLQVCIGSNCSSAGCTTISSGKAANSERETATGSTSSSESSIGWALERLAVVVVVVVALGEGVVFGCMPREEEEENEIFPFFHFTPHALQSVPAPSGPLRHIGVLFAPQYAHFLFIEGILLNSRSSVPRISIAMALEFVLLVVNVDADVDNAVDVEVDVFFFGAVCVLFLGLAGGL